MNRDPASSARKSTALPRRVESVLWLAAGAAWTIVALRAWNRTKKVDARRRTFTISDRILRQVFPRDILR